MYLLGNGHGPVAAWIRDEIEIEGPITKGARGRKARRVQEWLALNGIRLVIDEDFGNITERCVREFQKRKKLAETGVVDEETFSHLSASMRAVLSPPGTIPGSIAAGVNVMARKHLRAHPVEVGGQNSGPWVRMYMKGHQGASWPWCAGFVTFLMNQAAEIRDEASPIKGSFSCDTLAAQAKSDGLFLKEKDATPDSIVDGSFFLVRRTSTDWTHVGTVQGADSVAFGTIEGNTNDDGVREGFEVCARTRGYSSKDFIVF